MVSPLAKPARATAFADPDYGTCIVRATSNQQDTVPGFARSDYSRREAFNSDDSLYLITAADGSWHVYDAKSYRHVAALRDVAGDAEPQWHPDNPHLIRYLPRNGVGGKLLEVDVGTGKSKTLVDLAALLPKGVPRFAIWTKGEGSPSADQRVWCFMAEDEDFITRWIFTFDLEQQRIIAGIAAPADPDHVSMSPSGDWCVASYDNDLGVVAYSRDFKTSKRISVKGEHSDIATDVDGSDVFVTVDYESDRGDVYAYNLKSDHKQVLFQSYVEGSATAMHFSGKAYRRKGWVLLSTYASGSGPSQWFHENVFAMQLGGRAKVIQLAHHHSINNGYWTEPQASVNRDFTRVIFNSNWGKDAPDDVDAYVVELPDGWLGAAE